jgi:hypothetical protein
MRKFKDFILSDKFEETLFIILMLGMMLTGIWFGIIETILKSI